MWRPVLYFRGLRGRLWCLSALVASASDNGGPPPLLPASDADRPVAPRCLARRDGRSLWRYDFGLSLGDTERALGYRIGERRWRVDLPALGGALRLAYATCNGTETEQTGGEWPARNERWRHLAVKHERAPFHLLLHGGDQLYADTVWQEVPALAAWRRLPRRRRLTAAFSAEMAEAVASYYFARYRRLWGQPEIAPILAAVPSLMMWDDHDIFDGWGSHDPEWEECPVFRGIYAAAREHFALFQLGARPDELPEGFSDPRGGQFGWAYRLGEVGVVAPDLRSERTVERVMGEAGWRGLVAALEGMADCRHVLLLSSVPLVSLAAPALERLTNLLPGLQPYQLDLRDQWPSVGHHEEWTRLLRHLLEFSARTGARVTALSGEIHLGALGAVEGGGVRIHQLISSGVVHPPPPAPLVAPLEWIGAGTAAEADLTVGLLPLPGLGKRFLRARNWLALDLPVGGDLRATWHSAASSITVRLPLAAEPVVGGRTRAPEPAGRFCPPGGARHSAFDQIR